MTAPVPRSEPVLRIRSLGKTYGSGDTAVHALRNVDLDVRSNEFVALLGASGSGPHYCTSWAASTGPAPARSTFLTIA